MMKLKKECRLTFLSGTLLTVIPIANLIVLGFLLDEALRGADSDPNLRRPPKSAGEYWLHGLVVVLILLVYFAPTLLLSFFLPDSDAAGITLILLLLVSSYFGIYAAMTYSSLGVRGAFRIPAVFKGAWSKSWLIACLRCLAVTVGAMALTGVIAFVVTVLASAVFGIQLGLIEQAHQVGRPVVTYFVKWLLLPVFGAFYLGFVVFVAASRCFQIWGQAYRVR